MNWLNIYKKNDPNVKLMINMDRIQSIVFEYNETKLEEIRIDNGSDIYKIGPNYDQDKVLKQLGF